MHNNGLKKDAFLPTRSLQESSLLGWALSPSALDSALVPPSKAHLTEAGAVDDELQNILDTVASCS